MNTRTAQYILRECGWPIRVDGNMGSQTHTAIRDFQQMFAFWGRGLKATGRLGRRTRKALRYVQRHGYRCSEHWHFKDFACHDPNDPWIKGHRVHIRRMEKMRDRLGWTPRVLSGYRSPFWNRHVGGASESQHLYARAVDPTPMVPLSAVRGIFSGIGVDYGTGLVQHFDSRDTDPAHNYTHSTTSNPSMFHE